MLGYKELFNRKPGTAADVSDDVLRRILKAPNLGMHEDTSEHEKNRDVEVARKMMNRYGLEQAGAEPGLWSPSACCLLYRLLLAVLTSA